MKPLEIDLVIEIKPRMKIIDCFIFFNELDLLEFRLKILDKHVDYFVIAESNLTHSGKPKPYYFAVNRNRFEPWLDKIIYVPVKQTTEGLDFSREETSYNPQSAAFKLEYGHRNALSAATSVAAEEDLVLISDLDEIPDPFILKKIDLANGPVALSMRFHYYFFNCQNTGAEKWWNGTILCNGKQFKKTTPQELRNKRNIFNRIPKAGWHFSYLGGVEKIKHKIQSFAHTEFNKEEYLNDAHILSSIENGKDIFNRPDTIYKLVPIYYYPRYLRNAMLHYPDFLNTKNKKHFFITWLFYLLKNAFA